MRPLHFLSIGSQGSGVCLLYIIELAILQDSFQIFSKLVLLNLPDFVKVCLLLSIFVFLCQYLSFFRQYLSIVCQNLSLFVFICLHLSIFAFMCLYSSCFWSLFVFVC